MNLDGMSVNKVSTLFKQSTIRKLLIGLGILFAILITGKQLTTTPIYIIVVAMILTYGVDFLLSKTQIGNYAAGIINAMLMIILLPFPASIVMAFVIGYVSALPDMKLLPITLPITPLTIGIIWIVSKVVF